MSVEKMNDVEISARSRLFMGLFVSVVLFFFLILYTELWVFLVIFYGGMIRFYVGFIFRTDKELKDLYRDIRKTGADKLPEAPSTHFDKMDIIPPTGYILCCKHLEKTFFHTLTGICFGREWCLQKVINALNGLEEALQKGRRGYIIAMIAEVELSLPYLEKYYFPSTKFEVDSTRKEEYVMSKNLLLRIHSLLTAPGGSRWLLRFAMQGITHNLCYSIYGIYKEYKVCNDEVERWKKEKMRRALSIL